MKQERLSVKCWLLAHLRNSDFTFYMKDPVFDGVFLWLKCRARQHGGGGDQLAVYLHQTDLLIVSSRHHQADQHL